MLKKTILLSTLFLITFPFLAQEKITITGKVVDNLYNQPLEFATIVLKDTKTNTISGGITDSNGKFSVEAEKGNYTISIKFISFETITFSNQELTSNKDFGIIKLKEDSKSLNEVVVVAEKTTVDIRLDKKIYNIGKDLSVRGGNASDVLGNVPSVQVDVEGNVSLRGNENVTIFIDGRPSALVGLNGAEALRQIPAEAIEKVEVITSPSARYDAEGTAGILNIILRKNQLEGFNGSVQVDAGYPERYGTSINANWRTKKWNFFTNTGWNYRLSPGFALVERENFISQANLNSGDTLVTNYNENRDFNRLRRNLFTSFGTEYFINDNSSIVANIIYNIGNDDDNNTNTINRVYTNTIFLNTFRRQLEAEDEEEIQFTLDYVNNFSGKGKKLNISLQYSEESEDKDNDVTEVNIDRNGLIDLENVLEDQDENSALLQIDYVHPIGENMQFETGYRGNYRDIFNSFFIEEEEIGNTELLNPNGNLLNPNATLTPDLGLNNSFGYQEFVNAAYIQYGQEIKKISILAGLRYENTAIAIEQAETNTTDTNYYANWFPTLNLGYEIKDGESFTLGYNRRIRRPRGRLLNPFGGRSSETNVFTGNVNLQPVITDAVELGYLKRMRKVTVSSSLYYNKSDENWEFIQQLTGRETDKGDPIINRFPVNLSTQERLGWEFTFTYRPFKFWNINSDFNLFNVTTNGNYFNEARNETVDLSFKNTSYFFRVNQKFSLEKQKTDIQLNMNYRGPDQSAQNDNRGIVRFDLAVSKDLFRDKASLTFNINDIFNSRIRRRTTTTNTFSEYSEFQWRIRQFRLSFVYRFNQKKENKRGSREDFGGEDFEG